MALEPRSYTISPAVPTRMVPTPEPFRARRPAGHLPGPIDNACYDM